MNPRLAFMQDFLPVGVAIFDRASEGGLPKVVDAFTNSSSPLKDLRAEGEDGASSLRSQLDDFIPGLGNPVVNVDVEVENNSESEDDQGNDSLGQVLTRVEDRVQRLNDYFGEDLSDRINHD